MSSLVGKDIELDAVGGQFEPYLTLSCVCWWRPWGVTWDAVPEQTVGTVVVITAVVNSEFRLSSLANFIFCQCQWADSGCWYKNQPQICTSFSLYASSPLLKRENSLCFLECSGFRGLQRLQCLDMGDASFGTQNGSININHKFVPIFSCMLLLPFSPGK